MEKLFYADKTAFSSSTDGVEYIFRTFFNLTPHILRTVNGKPYLEGNPYYFSVSHTKKLLFVAISDSNVGIDAEDLTRKAVSPALLKKFTLEEQAEITSQYDFLKCWTAKESAIKFLGGTLAKDLKRLRFTKGLLSLDNMQIPFKATHFELLNHIVTVCCKNDFSKAEIIALP